MPRNRSSSTASATNPPSPALISRGFASLRRAHRRLSTSSPSSPVQNIEIPATTNNTSPSTTNNPLQVITNQEVNDSNVNLKPKLRLVPNVGLSCRSFVFDVIERELEPSVVYRIGRFSDRNSLPDRLSFKSKVVSRNHAELWTERGKVYLRDTGSSSGTFLNRLRLSAPSHVSLPHEIKDGDLIQLGVDYQGGIEPIYRAVRIRVELNRQTQTNSPYTRTAFQQLRNQFIATSPHDSNNLIQPTDLGLHREPTKIHEHSADVVAAPDQQPNLSDILSRMPADVTKADIQECCICLYAIAPFQALFIAPCSHIFHFKCLRPIVFQNYPGFSCPLCRSYFDLEASVAVEVDEVIEAMQQAKEQQQQQQQQPIPNKIDTVPEEEEDHPQQQQQQDSPPIPYIDAPEEDEEVQAASPTSSSISTPLQSVSLNEEPINVNSSSRTGRNGETLLSTTLVGSPIFDSNVTTNRI